MDDFELLVDAAKRLVNANSHRMGGYGYSSSMSPAHWLLEFRTLRLDVGRGVGKSKYIKDHARDGDLLVVPSLKFFKTCYPEGVDCHMIKANQPFHPLGARPRVIYVDELSICEREYPGILSLIAHTFGRSVGQMIVAFG